MDNIIVNKVSQSPLMLIDLKDFYPKKEEYCVFDLSDFLFEKLILKEKEFRQALKETDYSKYQDKYVGVYCSENVVIPQWAYLLATVHLYPYVKKIFYGSENVLIQKVIEDKINKIDTSVYMDKPVVIKGCSEVEINLENYVLLINRLMNVAKSIMYGEPCSTVPLFKRK